MKNKIVLIICTLSLLITQLNSVSSATETNILIVSDNNAMPWYDGANDAADYQNIIGNSSYSNNLTYNTTFWSQELSGSPSLSYMKSFGIIIWATGSFWGYAPSANDIIELEDYIEQGGSLIISGTFILYDWRQNSFTDNVLHANCPEAPYGSTLNSVNVSNITHPVMAGFSQNELLPVYPHGGYTYETDVIHNIVGDARELAIKGPYSSYPAIVAFENSTSSAKVLYLAFPIYLLNETNSTLIVRNALRWMDKYAPSVINISLNPGSDEDIDPNVQINFTANITDISNVSSATFQYRCAASAGLCSPGTDIFTNITLIYNNITKLYENASFTPDVPGIWQYRIWTNDSLNNNQNYTETYNLSVQYDYSWTRTPSSFGAISCLFYSNCTLGNLTISNTGDYSLDFDLGTNYESISFNATEPFSIAAKEIKIIQVNATTVGTKAEYSVTITIDSTTSNANPSVQYTTAELASYAGGAYPYNTLINYQTTANQSSTINLYGSVKNLGNETAINTTLAWIMPSSNWINISGNLTKEIGNLTEDSTSYNNITINIPSSASPGAYTIYLNSSCANTQETCSDTESLMIYIYCSNSDSICGAGCSYETSSANYDSDCTAPLTTPSSGGGGGGSAAEKKATVYNKKIEIVRGEENKFNIEISNTFEDSELRDLQISLSGFLGQYIEISPEKIESVKYNETKSFEINLSAPSYKDYEEYDLKAIIMGKLIIRNKTTDYTETQWIKLIIQEISREEAQAKLEEAKNAINDMKSANFPVSQAEKKLTEADSMFSIKQHYKPSWELSESIIKTRETAFEANDLIRKIIESMQNPKKESLISGNAVKKAGSGDKSEPLKELLTGKVVFASSSVQEIADLSIAAFEREDYASALERAKEARNLLILGRKGNIIFFIYLYWPYLILATIILSGAGILGYRRYKKLTLSEEIRELNKKEDSIRILIVKNQKDYFTGKISNTEYQTSINQHHEELAKIRKRRSNLRNIRIKLLQPEQITENLKNERTEIEKDIKKMQEQFYINKNITEQEYKIQFETLNERLAEIEDENTTLEFLNKKQTLSDEKETEKSQKMYISLSNKARDIWTKLIRKLRRAEKGAFIIDKKIIDALKEYAIGRDLRGKWINLSIKNREEPKK